MEDFNSENRLYQNSGENNDVDHLVVSRLYDDDTEQRKSSISFDKIKQISLTYSLQSEDECQDDEEVEEEQDNNQGCDCRRESSCSNCGQCGGESGHSDNLRKASVIKVEKSVIRATNFDSDNLPPRDEERQPNNTANKVNAIGTLDENLKGEENSFNGGDQKLARDADGRTNGPRYLQSNPFAGDGEPGNQADADQVRVNCGMGITTRAASVQSGAAANRLVDARGGQGEIENRWPAQDLSPLKQHTRSDSRMTNRLYNDDSGHTPVQFPLQSGPHQLAMGQNGGTRILYSPRRNQLITPAENRPILAKGAVYNRIGRVYPLKERLTGGDNSLGLRLRQHNNSISLVVYNESDANVMVSDDPGSCSDESYWGSAAIETESAIGRHIRNVDYSSEDELLEVDDQLSLTDNRDLNAGLLRDSNNTSTRNMAIVNGETKQTPPPPPPPAPPLPYPTQRPSNRRVESLNQHDLNNQAVRRSRYKDPKADNSYRVDTEAVNHHSHSYRQPGGATEQTINLQPRYRQTFSQARNSIGNQDSETQPFSGIGIDQAMRLNAGQEAAFEDIRSAINGAEAEFPSMRTSYRGPRNPLTSEERIASDTQNQLNYFVHDVAEDNLGPRTNQQNGESISSGYATMANQVLSEEQRRPVVGNGHYVGANMSNGVYRDYQPRLGRQAGLKDSSIFDQELIDRQLMHEQDLHDQYSIYASPHRRPKSYSNDSRIPFRGDNHRINIVVSSPQRYIRPKKRLNAPHMAQTSSHETSRRDPRYRQATTIRQTAAERASTTNRAPVDYWQQSSPSSVCSPSGWSGFGYVQEGDHTPTSQAQVPASSSATGISGDRMSQRYQIDCRSSLGRNPPNQRQDEIADSRLSPIELNTKPGDLNEMDFETGIRGPKVANTPISKQASNQYVGRAAVANRYASSDFENADSNSKAALEACTRAEGTEGTGTAEQPAPQQQPSQKQTQAQTQTEVSAAASSGCPLFAAARPIKLRNLLNGEQMVDTLHTKYKHNNKSHGCNDLRCLGSIINPLPVEHKVRSVGETFQHAKEFINNYYASIKRLDSPAHKSRLDEIESQIRLTETYYLKETELIYGAKLAWRNASRCIGRIQWSKLQVFDARFTTNAAEMFEAVCNHIKYATNKGSLRSAITIFPQRVKSTNSDWRIWNSQLIGFAGYRDQATGKIVGDPANADFTEICQKLGWKGKGTRFDVLPLVLSAGGGTPQLFSLPEDLVMRVKIRHPKYKWFEELGLEWYALPAVSSMMLDVGGLQFTAAPFSGWYMVTEIGTRDLGDASRYNVLEEVAQKMGLNTTSNMTLWKDQALVELNIAVLDSYQSAGVTIVDHHTASETFMTHLANEQRLRGGCPADWVWLVPPTGGSTTQVFHQEMVNYHLLPNYEYLDPVWKNYDWTAWERQQHEQSELRKRNSIASTNAAAVALTNGSPLTSHGLAAMSPKIVGPNGADFSPRKRGFKEIARAVKFTSKLFGKALSRRIKATILFATETGKSERFANKLAKTFSCAFNVHLMSMSDYDLTCLEHEALLLVVTSTFGNGDPPENGELFAKHLAAVKLTGDTSPDIESINSVSTNPFFQMISEDHKDSSLDVGDDNANSNTTTSSGSNNKLGDSNVANKHLGAANNTQDKQEQQTNIRPLSNVRFSVFALGSTAYPHFCAYGRYVDQTLGELGAERILKCALGDELGGQEKAFNEWSNQVFKTACDVFCLTDSIGTLDDRHEAVWSPSDVRFVPVELIGESEKNNNLLVNSNTPNGKGANSRPADSPATITAKRDKSTGVLTSKKTIVRNLMSITNKKIIPFKVMNRVNLHQYLPEENLQTLCIDLESDMISTAVAQDGSKQSLVLFEPGDHVAIYPMNKFETVEKILDRMQSYTTNGDSKASLDFNQVYTILVKRENMDLTPAASMAAAQGEEHWIAHDRLPVTSIREALTRYLDITSPPNQEFLLILSRQTADSEERKRLQQLAKSFSLYEEWKSKKVPSLLSLLEEFKTIKFEPALVTQIPLMKPRFYSISGTISLTVGVVRFKSSFGEPREGLCSNYLNTIPIDSTGLVYGYVRSAPAFHMPSDKSIPIILVSAGTGIAPFRSFWQQRYMDMYGFSSGQPKQLVRGNAQENGSNFTSTFGRIEMYFGCRNSNYILYKDELDEMYECGVLSCVEIAFSRPIDRDVIEDRGSSTDANGSVSDPNRAVKSKTSRVAGIKQARRRMYVQDRLLEHGKDLFELIMHHGAHVYVCGDVAMADGVYKTLTNIINDTMKTQKTNDRNSGISPVETTTIETSPTRSPARDDGESVLMNLRNLNRYHEDIFGAKQMS